MKNSDNSTKVHYTRYLIFFSLVTIVLLLYGCPDVRRYQPLPKWEAQFFAEARRDIFPNDIRNCPEQYTKTLVVWTGIIKNMEYDNNDSGHLVRFTVEHHYFDWIEDDGIQREKFFLSPRGEGIFLVAWGAGSPEDKRFIEQFAIGDMIIAYGYPVIHDTITGLYPTQNLRAIKLQWYRTDILDYGRPGEPCKTLKTPF